MQIGDLAERDPFFLLKDKKNVRNLEKYFEDDGCRILERQSVLLFFNSSEDSTINLLHIGIINSRNSSGILLENYQNRKTNIFTNCMLLTLSQQQHQQM
jgi:hypothetical protein